MCDYDDIAFAETVKMVTQEYNLRSKTNDLSEREISPVNAPGTSNDGPLTCVSVDADCEEEEEDDFPSTQGVNVAGVIVTWNWDLSQKRPSPQKNFLASRKRRQTKPASPVAVVPTQRKRVLRKPNPKWTTQLQALSDKLTKTRENGSPKRQAIYNEIRSTEVNEGNCIKKEVPEVENGNISTAITKDCHQEVVEVSKDQEYLKKTPGFESKPPQKSQRTPGRHSFSDLFEELDDDSLIRCSQQVECLVKPVTTTPYVASHGESKMSGENAKIRSPKFLKSTNNKVTTPAKVISSKHSSSSTFLRRSPRLCTKVKVKESNVSRGASSAVLQFKITDYNSNRQATCSKPTEFDDQSLLSFLDEDIELLSQVPDIDSVAKSPHCSENGKSGKIGSCKPEFRNIQHHNSLELSLKESVYVAKASSKGCIESSHETGNKLPLMQKTHNTVTHNVPRQQINLQSLGSSVIIPDVLNVLENTELKASSLLSCSPPGNKNVIPQNEEKVSPLPQCTPEEIQVKRMQALQKLRSSHDVAKLNVQFHQRSLSKSMPVGTAVKPKQNNSNSQRCTAEEIERKRQEALQKIRQKQKEKAMLNSGKLKYRPLSTKHIKR